MASVAAHPGGSPISPARRCPSKGTRIPLPPCNECLPRALSLVSACQGALKPSSEHVASKKRASGQRRGSPMPPARLFPSKGTRMPLPPRQRVPSPGTRPRLDSLRSPQALERACCLGKELDASSPCLYQSYEGFTRCSCVLVKSRLRTSRGSTCDDAPCSCNELSPHHPLHSKPQALQQALSVAIPWFLCCLPNGWNCPSNVTYLRPAPAHAVRADLKSDHHVPWLPHSCKRMRGVEHDPRRPLVLSDAEP
uniref:Uncharacterized protein n=1 Tax=Vitis vinifera TaxID=29760 RepID=A5AMN1_VITVI|nr:hypothetical protein VITISV_003450 [Vitis vinifera]